MYFITMETVLIFCMLCKNCRLIYPRCTAWIIGYSVCILCEVDDVEVSLHRYHMPNVKGSDIV